MEHIVSKFEKEMDITVDRYDIVRDRNAKLLYDLLQETLMDPLTSQPSSVFSRISTSQKSGQEDVADSSNSSGQQGGHPYNTLYAKKKRVVGPLLYHRNSRQLIQDIHTARNSLKMRSWIKGRLLFLIDDGNTDENIASMGKEQAEHNQFISEGDHDDDGRNGWVDEGLTELQQQGKERMIQRMKEGRKQD